MEILAGAPVLGFGSEIRHVDDQRVAFPPASRIAPPLAQLGRRMWCRRDRDHTLVTLSLEEVIVECHGRRRLDDPAVPTEFGQTATKTPFVAATILGTVGPVDPLKQTVAGWISRWRLCVPP